MSDSGIIVYNDSNKLVLNNSYKNFYVSRKLPISGTGTTTGTFQNGELLAAVGGINANNIDAYCENGVNGWTCTVKTYQSGLCVCVLSTNVPDTEHGVGLEIFDASGMVIFNSNVNPARVLMFGHNEAVLPTNNSYKYAIATGSHVSLPYYRRSYARNISYSTVYHPAQTHYEAPKYEMKTIHHPAEYSWQQVYNSTTKQYELQYVKTKDAYDELQWTQVSPGRTVVDKAAYTEYITSWSDTMTEYTSLELKNFSVSNGRIELTTKSFTEKYWSQSSVVSSGKQSSTTGYPGVNPLPNGYDASYAYTINPTSFLLFDVSGC